MSIPASSACALDRNASVLITGGAGFIGSHLANALIEAGCRVRILDALTAQVHGPMQSFPDYLHPEVECIPGDIRNRSLLERALTGITHVCHLAACVGVGQSMYQMEQYTDVNTRGTAMLLEALSRSAVQRLVVASSMSVYGEGLYRRGDSDCETGLRSREQLGTGQWEIHDEHGPLEPVATPETKQVAPASVYALSKYDQEQLCLMYGAAYGVPTVALRFFNAYGPHQSLSNPYTGVLAIFASRCLNGNPPLIFEDGLQRRDFVSVHDVVHACLLALTTRNAGQVFNVGSGEARTVLDIAASVTQALGLDIEPVVTGKYRTGDIRHCYADIGKARHLLQYQPRVSFEYGLAELVDWLAGAPAQDNFMLATSELDRRGLTL